MIIIFSIVIIIYSYCWFCYCYQFYVCLQRHLAVLSCADYECNAAATRMQAAMYATAAAPKVFESSRTPDGKGGFSWYLPATTSDQRTCQTCVAQAVATAVQMSVARTLRDAVDNHPISAMALYYCTGQGRSCQTGWVSMLGCCVPAYTF